MTPTEETAAELSVEHDLSNPGYAKIKVDTNDEAHVSGIEYTLRGTFVPTGGIVDVLYRVTVIQEMCDVTSPLSVTTVTPPTYNLNSGPMDIIMPVFSFSGNCDYNAVDYYWTVHTSSDTQFNF